MSNDTFTGQYSDPAFEADDMNDDEIVDLLQAVKPGKRVAGSPSAEEEEDFSADPEAMLDRLSNPEKSLADSERHVPLPDPTHGGQAGAVN